MHGAELSALLFLGLLMAAGFTVGTFGERVGLPRVAMYVAVGALLSEGLLGRFYPGELGTWTDTLTTTALGVIAFLVGAEIDWGWLRKQGRPVLLGVFGQSIATVLVVTLGAWAYSHFVLESVFDIATVMVLGAIASATAPAATIAVIEEYRARGPLTSMLLSIVAIDDALAILYFTFAMSLTAANAGFGWVWESGREILGAVATGMLLGGVLGWYGRRFRADELRLPVVLGFIFLTLGLASVARFSALLSCMVLGFVSRNLFKRAEGHWLSPMRHIQETVFLVFFTLAGVHFAFSAFVSALGFMTVYVVLRTAGKYAGAWAGTRLGGAPKSVYANVGLGLLPQAGVAVGLALSAVEAGGLSEHQSLILNTVLGSTILYELAAPFLARRALSRAGEISRGAKSD
jgi:Kef-type K+ transport system membrane component KefB